MEERPLVGEELEAFGRPDGQLGAFAHLRERELAGEPEQPGADALGADAELEARLRACRTPRRRCAAPPA